MPNTDDFKSTMQRIFRIAETINLAGIVIRSGNLHKLIGDYPGPDHRMPICCSVMRQMMNPGDVVINEPPKGQGANLEILYKSPYHI